MRFASIRIGHITIFVCAPRSLILAIIENVHCSLGISIPISLNKQKAVKPQRIDSINWIVVDLYEHIEPGGFSDMDRG
jgi:hypothetical protein